MVLRLGTPFTNMGIIYILNIEGEEEDDDDRG